MRFTRIFFSASTLHTSPVAIFKPTTSDISSINLTPLPTRERTQNSSKGVKRTRKKKSKSQSHTIGRFIANQRHQRSKKLPNHKPFSLINPHTVDFFKRNHLQQHVRSCPHLPSPFVLNGGTSARAI